MSKRRMFDIDFPEGAAPEPAPSTEARRGPMASAISENADALRVRSETETAIRVENDRLAHEHVRLKKEGLITDLIALDAIHTTKLTRDRSTDTDPDLEGLMASIQAIGLSNPIRVEAEDDGYQLVQGYRRLSAYRALYARTGDEAFARIPAGLVAHGEALEALYRRMVDENLVRRDISFGEMAQLALSYAADPETACESVEDAVAELYASANRQKRVYIRHFATLLEQTRGKLNFPQIIPRALGLQLEKKLSSVEGAPAVLRQMLNVHPHSTAEIELDLLRTFLARHIGAKPDLPAPKVSAKTTFRTRVPAGTVRCAARNGKVELSLDRDFTAIDRTRLDAAVTAFFKALDG